MYKFFKISTILILIFFIMFTFISNISLATENISETSATANDSLSTEDYLSNSGINNVQRLTSIPEANLGLNNILSIILISIGVLIILLAIAILIRLGR